MKEESPTSRSEHLPACGQVTELSKYIGWNGYLRGTDGSDTFLLPLRLAERMSVPSRAEAGRLNPGYSTQALLVYLMNAAIFELRKPESRRHHPEFPEYQPKAIAARLGYSSDTVRRAMKRLRERGIVWLDGDGKVRFDLTLLWNLCAWKPDSDKLSPAKAEMLDRIVAMSAETRLDVIAEEQARCIKAILNPSCCVELPMSLVDGPVGRGERPDWAQMSIFAYLVYRFMPWRDRKTHELRQHFRGIGYQIHRKHLRSVFRCGNDKLTKRLGQLVEGGYILRLVTKGTRPLRQGEQPLVWEGKKRRYRLSSTSNVFLNVEKYVSECHARKVEQASGIADRRTTNMAKPHQNSRWRSRHEVPMPQEGTLTEENIATYLDRISLRHNKDAGRQQELAEKAQEALGTFGLTAQHLGELYALYLNTPALWYPRKDAPNEPIRFAIRWLTEQAGLAKTLAYERDTASSRAAEARKAEIEAMTPRELFEKAVLVQDADEWWYYRPDPASATMVPIDASRYADESEARQLLGYMLGVVPYEAVAGLI